MSIPFGTKIQSHIFKHLNASKDCRDKYDISCYKILDHANIYTHIERLKPELNKQVEHVSLSLHFKIYPLLFTGSFNLLFVISFCLCLSFYWLYISLNTFHS